MPDDIDGMSYDEDSGEDDQSCYEIHTMGDRSCAICEGVDGSIIPGQPGPLHEHCDCETTLVEAGAGQASDCNSWSIGSYGCDPWEGVPGNYTVHMHVDIHVECWNGRYTMETIDIDIQVSDSVTDEDVWEGVYEQAEALVAVTCPPCPIREVS